MRKMVALSWLVVAMAGCEERAPEAADNGANARIEVRSESQKRLFAMNEADRLIGLKRAILATGYGCPRSEASNFIGTFKNMDMWAVRCSDQREWALFIGADDSVQVRLCEDTAKVGLPPCNFDKVAKPAAD